MSGKDGDGMGDLAWLEDAMTMELEASEEMLRSCRQQLSNEIAEKDKALQNLSECTAQLQNRNQDLSSLRDSLSRQGHELDLLRAERIESDRQHEEEVTRLRTELRMARRHEEFLAKELESNRSASSRRLNELQLQSNSEMQALRTDVHALTLRCEELSTGRSIIANTATPRNEARDGTANDALVSSSTRTPLTSPHSSHKEKSFSGSHAAKNGGVLLAGT